MAIILVTGVANINLKMGCLRVLLKKIPSAVYLNFDHLLDTFSQPAESAFTAALPLAKRVNQPSHEVLLGLIADNLASENVVIVDGNFDCEQIAAVMAQGQFSWDGERVRALHFHSANPNISDSLKKLVTDGVVKIDTRVEIGKLLLELIGGFSDLKNEGNKSKSRKMLVMSSGLAGTGKTTHMLPICTQFTNSLYLDTDRATFPYLRSAKQSLSSPYYAIHVRNQRYAVMFQFARDQIALGGAAFLDGCFGDKLTCDFVKGFLADDTLLTTALYFHSPETIQYERVKARGEERDADKLNDFSNDRRKNLEKHLVEFAQTSHIVFVDAADEKVLENNIGLITKHLDSSDAKSLAIARRTQPFDKKLCDLTAAQAQGDLKTFQALLKAIKAKDRLAQHAAKPLKEVAKASALSDAKAKSLPAPASTASAANGIVRSDQTSVAIHDAKENHWAVFFKVAIPVTLVGIAAVHFFRRPGK